MEEQTIQKNYYAVLPANVRYDKNLTPNAKLLYAEVTALSNEKGYCWATNEYFAKLYGVTKTCIINWVNQLIDYGYLSKEVIYKEGSKEILSRWLKIIDDPSQKNLTTPSKNILTDNNKDTNTKKENNINRIKEIIKETQISEKLKNILIEWVDYKKEKRQVYTETGFKKLLNDIIKLSLLYKDDEIIESFNSCMANNYQGFFMKTQNMPPKKKEQTMESRYAKIAEDLKYIKD